MIQTTSPRDHCKLFCASNKLEVKRKSIDTRGKNFGQHDEEGSYLMVVRPPELQDYFYPPVTAPTQGFIRLATRGRKEDSLLSQVNNRSRSKCF
jgi:hypothetical protein